MSDKPIQEQLGEGVIKLFTEFARKDIAELSVLESNEFAHVQDKNLRKHLAITYYGSRWIYKLGLTLLVSNVERVAHINSQIISYAMISEALLHYSVGDCLAKGKAKGYKYKYINFNSKKGNIDWSKGDPFYVMSKLNLGLYWFNHIAHSQGIITSHTHEQVETLRKRRNKIHIRSQPRLSSSAYINESKESYTTMRNVIRLTKAWADRNP